MLAPPSQSGAPPGYPADARSIKVVCTLGGGLQAWVYTAFECGGSVAFVYDMGAQFPQMNTCSAPTYSFSQKLECLGTQETPLPPSYIGPAPSYAPSTSGSPSFGPSYSYVPSSSYGASPSIGDGGYSDGSSYGPSPSYGASPSFGDGSYSPSPS